MWKTNFNLINFGQEGLTEHWFGKGVQGSFKCALNYKIRFEPKHVILLGTNNGIKEQADFDLKSPNVFGIYFRELVTGSPLTKIEYTHQDTSYSQTIELKKIP